ncbi:MULTISPECIES: TIGR03364 family FAD-dependent oxidoreductase [unclassified Flavobacterium]|jgi:FAD dependent oxidoreductase TIGR03364|uniref:TIGR03364 family FAD-dependent oxidoreductase n=1 Tax=unclassified Flavobacterium TaxID=196869 RepID=UPI0025B7C472|nr:MULTISPECIES: TIGR03364 family FAD-dependent oxidoreductase [unclassified Flavobacterium]
MNCKTDLIVVGGGVLGTFHAFHALQNGLTVTLFEKDKQPLGATVRNFGQVVPSGMDIKWQQYGRESLKLYKEIQQEIDLTVRQNGTVYIASNEEELTLLEELHQINKSNDYLSKLLTKEECIGQFSGVKPSYALGGLFFPEEATVDSIYLIHQFQKYLIDKYKLKYITNTAVKSCESVGNDIVKVTTANDDVYESSKVIICNGSDFKLLYPELYNDSDLEVTKLQILQTKPQENYTLKGNILTGLSIRRYESFSECSSYKFIKEKEAIDSLEKKWGIHIIFKQGVDGSIYFGDSHEYADAKDADLLGYELNMEIDNFMIQEAKKIIDFPNWELQRRWTGVYSQCKNKDIFQKTIDNNIHIVTGIGGKGMTGSGGFSKENIATIFNLNTVSL